MIASFILVIIFVLFSNMKTVNLNRIHQNIIQIFCNVFFFLGDIFLWLIIALQKQVFSTFLRLPLCSISFSLNENVVERLFTFKEVFLYLFSFSNVEYEFSWTRHIRIYDSLWCFHFSIEWLINKFLAYEMFIFFSVNKLLS